MATAVALLTVSLAAAESKFPNKDTAKNRQDNVMTNKPEPQEGEEPVIVIEKNEDETTMKTNQPKKEQKNWRDDIFITVQPEVNIKP